MIESATTYQGVSRRSKSRRGGGQNMEAIALAPNRDVEAFSAHANSPGLKNCVCCSNAWPVHF